MKTIIIERLRQIGSGYDLDKLPTGLMNAIIETATPLIEAEVNKAQDRAVQRIINERFVAKAIKTALESK